jgi:Rrf2 family protein
MAFYSARVEYALHTLLNLSFAPAGSAPSARDLADFQRLSVGFVQKLLTQLEKAGLVVASEGRSGGWQLARNPGAISVLEVAEAARSGEDSLFECREIRARCALWPDRNAPRAATSGVCSIHAVMLAAEAAMRRELAHHTLADLAARVREKSSATWTGSVQSWFTERFAERYEPNPGSIARRGRVNARAETGRATGR